MLSKNTCSEQLLYQIANKVCTLSWGDILLIGGGAVLPEITGFKKLRLRSNDLDFITNDKGLEKILEKYKLKPETELNMPFVEGGCKFTYIDDILVAFFHNQIRGYTIPKETYKIAIVKKTSQGVVYTARPELNMALKIRRGASKTHIYGKDGLDFASIVSGLYDRGHRFDPKLFTKYMAEGVCQSCNLNSKTECITALESGAKNLPFDYRINFYNMLHSCKEYVKYFCRQISSSNNII